MKNIMTTKKERIKLTPEQLFAVYQECSVPGAAVKLILERHGLRPWELVEIRKKVRQGAIDALASKGKPGRPIAAIPVEQYLKTDKELSQTKDALAAVGHELSLLKKRVS